MLDTGAMVTPSASTSVTSLSPLTHHVTILMKMLHSMYPLIEVPLEWPPSRQRGSDFNAALKSPFRDHPVDKDQSSGLPLEWLPS